ncbi:hypothetical protein D3C80_1312040 [compost metagenome]
MATGCVTRCRMEEDDHGRLDVTDRNFTVSVRRRGHGANCPTPGDWRGAGLPDCRYCHWPLGIGFHSRRRRDPALFRIGRGVPDVYHRAGTESEQAVGTQALNLWRRRRASADHRRRAGRAALSDAFCLAGRRDWRYRVGDVLNRDGAATDAREGHEPQRRRPVGVLGAAVPGYGGDPGVGADPDPGRSRRQQR